MNPDRLIEIYGLDSHVAIGDPPKIMTLGQALQFETMFCPADINKREDSAKRLGYLAGMLHSAGSLKSEHNNLISKG